MRNNRPILLVEDDRVDAMTIERALRDIEVQNELIVAEDGEVGLCYLRNSATAQPCIIFLDINLPRMNGLEFLERIKEDRELCVIPVVVLTSSREECDKRHCFEHCVAGYMLKPVEYKALVDLLSVIDRYWTLSQLPLSGSSS
jgi:CheY-like chemotaxis protein